MSTRRIAYLLRLALALALVALEFTNLFLWLAGGGKSGPKMGTQAHSPFTLELLANALCGLILLLDVQGVKRLIHKSVFRWCFAVLILFTWGMVVRSFRAPAGLEAYDFNRVFFLQVNALAFLVACLVVFDDPRVLRFGCRAIALATLFGVILNVYEVLHPGTFGNTPGRAAGLYINSNTSGMALALGCLIGITAVPRIWREAFVLAAIVGVVATFSREAMLAIVIVTVAAYVGRALAPRRVVFACVVGGVLFTALGVREILNSGKILTADNLPRLTFTSSDTSAHDRLRLAQKALEQFEEAPLLGQGFGTTSYWTETTQSHNLYLSLMADFGLLGAFIIPALVWSVARGRSTWDSYAFAALFMIWCAFDHQVLGYSFALLGVAMQADQPRLSKEQRTPIVLMPGHVVAIGQE
jgi:hypothetical protein